VYSYHDEHKTVVPITNNANDDSRFLPLLRLTCKNRKLPHHKSNKTQVTLLVPIKVFKKKILLQRNILHLALDRRVAIFTRNLIVCVGSIGFIVRSLRASGTIALNNFDLQILLS
jgi:hypothetical protein